MRLIPLIFLLACFCVHAQNSRFFPQEQLLIPACNNQEDPDCVENFFQEKVYDFLNDSLHYDAFSKFKKDTLKTYITLVFNDDGKMENDLSFVSVGEKEFNTEKGPELKTLLSDTLKVKLINRKPLPDISEHAFRFSYRIVKDTNALRLTKLPIKENYTGGYIEEFPRFTDCKEVARGEEKSCFQQQLFNHIRNNFQYPKSASGEGAQGTVYVTFTINEKGRVTNIQTRGRRADLEFEAGRIIRMLPPVEPGKRNGKPAEKVFSIPIGFRLN